MIKKIGRGCMSAVAAVLSLGSSNLWAIGGCNNRYSLNALELGFRPICISTAQFSAGFALKIVLGYKARKVKPYVSIYLCSRLTTVDGR